MPIPGLTDATASFKEIGRIRKGAPKDQGLKDLRHFRWDLRPDEAPRYLDTLLSVYGGQPTRINIRIPFKDITRCWDANYMVYNTSGLLGQAGGLDGQEGLFWQYLRDNKSGALIVRNWRREDSGEPMVFDPAIPVYSYRSKKSGQDVPVFAKPEGRLKVILPLLRVMNYFTLVTHSVYDIANISRELTGIAEIAEGMGMSLPQVPLILSRRMDTVSVAIDGKKHMEEKSLVHIDIDPTWSGPAFDLLNALVPGAALPERQVIELPALPAGVADDESEDELETEAETSAASATPPANGNGNKSEVKRPSPPPAKAPAPANPPTVAIMREFTTSKGSRFGDLADDQLAILIEKSKDAKFKTAAQALKAPAGPDDWDAYYKIVERADLAGLTVADIGKGVSVNRIHQEIERLEQKIKAQPKLPIDDGNIPF